MIQEIMTMINTLGVPTAVAIVGASGAVGQECLLQQGFLHL